MKKLRAREVDNVAHIDWHSSAESTWGTYVGYSEDYTCTLSNGPKPVGKIKYREMTYEKRGATMAEAKESASKVTEIYETSELFSFIKGKWDY